MPSVHYRDILDFWFDEPTSKCWFNSTPEFDNLILKKYQNLWEQAAGGALDSWQTTHLGSLSLVIILDQLPLNMFRGTSKSFSTESSAIAVTRNAITKKFDLLLDTIQLPFLYMPLMHSENLNDQNDSVHLFEQAGLESNLRFAKHHQNIIKKYGRFPHRNVILNRPSTDDELVYLSSPHAFKG
ncbi:MAG: DUF924 family protein [Gammaproteobacteria bacterium]